MASDAQRMVDSLKMAFADIVRQPKLHLTRMTNSQPHLYSPASLMFETSLDAKFWSGDLVAKQLSGLKQDTVVWSAAAQLEQQLGAGKVRKLYTNLPGNNAVVTGAVAFNAQTINLSGWTAEHVNYLRGDASQELSMVNPAGKFRQRITRLGDIANSAPAYSYAQDQGYTFLEQNLFKNAADSYATFLAAQAATLPLVAVGANDGMLHLFNANTGDELYGYIPRSVLPELIKLTAPSYQHQYFVDGSPTISHAYINQQWKNIVVGATGAGGNSVFAIDVSQPNQLDAGSVLWEFSDADLGGFTGKPSVVALPNGEFGVVFSSGVNRVDAKAGYVWVLNAGTGAVIKKIKLNTTGDLGEPLVVAQMNQRVMANSVFVADSLGKVWQLDLSAANPSQWQVAYNGQPLFVAQALSGETQPVTAPLNAAYTAEGKLMLLVATGSLYRQQDIELSKQNRVAQSVYGIVVPDKDGKAYSSTQITQGIYQFAAEQVAALTAPELEGKTIKQQKSATGDNANLSGSWRYDVTPANEGEFAERFLVQPLVRNGVVVVTSYLAEKTPCGNQGTNWTYFFSLRPTQNLHTQVLNQQAANGNYFTALKINSSRDYNAGPTIIENKVVFHEGTEYELKKTAPPENTEIKTGRISWFEERDSN